jgi:two-component system sensor histidine kinase GlrK
MDLSGKKLTIFPRLIIGYLTIFILMMTVSVYPIIKLRQFNKATRHILNIDYHILDLDKKLADSLLSQLRYEKKYIITKDVALYNQFLSAKDEFEKYLIEVASAADTLEKRNSLDTIKSNYAYYQSLIEEEVKFVRMQKPYYKKRYEQGKEKATDGILEELGILENSSRQDIENRMKVLGEAFASALRVSIVMVIIIISLVITTSFFITMSVTKPLSLLMEKTGEISEGIFRGDLTISSPPEISALAKAFNSMCGKLHAVDKMKSDFFSTMSHELRTPLTSIKEGTSLLLGGEGGSITDQQKKILTILSEESNRLINQVNSVLDLSKMEAGMMTYTIEQTNLRPLIEQVTREIGPLVEAKKICVEAEIDEKLPAVRIDCERILQALRNLVGNAVKFTPHGGRVNINARPVHQGVEVSVKDTGPGISAGNFTTIFDKFQQVTAPGLYRTKGTGLGLAIAKHIITSHGGRIWVESESGKGSTFTFILPS